MKILVALNERGRVIGENHPRAKLLNAEVDQVMDLLDDGYSLGAVAAKMGVSKSCIQKIKDGTRRCQTPERLVEVSMKENE